MVYTDQRSDKTAVALLACADPLIAVSSSHSRSLKYAYMDYPSLCLREWVEVTIPTPYSTKIKKALDADARNVRLSTLVGGSGTWYGFGKLIVDLWVILHDAQPLANTAFRLQEPQSTDLAKVLTDVSPGWISDGWI